MKQEKLTAVLLLTCNDQPGLVARICQFLYEYGGNILDLDEHVETQQNRFFLRIAWDMQNFRISAADLHQAFKPLAEDIKADWRINFLQARLRLAIFVSKYDHCLQEILWRYSLGEYPIDIPLIISNHEKLKPLVDRYDIPFHYFPINKSNKAQQEQAEIALMKEHQVDTVILARYMQILSEDFVNAFPNQIINIHHSFLPAFIGGNPYQQAFDRGVKLIGATSHYVTADLDQGPIIEQDIARISHRDTVMDLKRKGRDLERLVLAKAIKYHSEHRVLSCDNKTVVFE